MILFMQEKKCKFSEKQSNRTLQVFVVIQRAIYVLRRWHVIQHLKSTIEVIQRKNLIYVNCAIGDFPPR